MPDPIERALAHCLLAGQGNLDRILFFAEETCGRRWVWLRPLARRFLASHNGAPGSWRLRDALFFLRNDAGFQAARHKYREVLQVLHFPLAEPRMHPAPAALDWDIPVLTTLGDLADWLWLQQNQLSWFADLKGLACKRGPDRAHHYFYRMMAKSSGGLRLIEAPKRRLKSLQRAILDGILAHVPAHPAAHAFLPGRSIRTFAAPHAGQAVVLRMDLRDFFAAFTGPRVQAAFRTMGYPEAVADVLGGICTNVVPKSIWHAEAASLLSMSDLQAMRELYARPHLPQGAPGSPALANVCFYRVDCRLAGLARSADAVYTRYADDLAFSGDTAFERRAERFSLHAAAVLLEEGFAVHHRKTRIMRRAVRQHLAGLVTNEKLNVARRDYDLLKATLTNCIRRGPASQNREERAFFREHLEGRVAFVESIHGGRGARLRALFNRIVWP